MNLHATLLLCLAFSCASVHMGADLSPDRVAFIQEGITTEAELRAALGEPGTVVLQADGTRTLHYQDVRSEASAMNASVLIPFYTKVDSSTSTRQLVVTVSPAGVVTKAVYTGPPTSST